MQHCTEQRYKLLWGFATDKYSSDREDSVMNRNMHRETRALADTYRAGTLSRRAFVTRLLALGVLAPVVAGLAAEIRPASAADLKGKVRFLVGPWSDGEIDHHKHIAQGFNALHPDVTFDYR